MWYTGSSTLTIERRCYCGSVRGEPAAFGKVVSGLSHGMKAALLAPTAMNQQKFLFTLNGDKVSAKAGFGFYSKIDLGIAKYHFELGAGPEHFKWA